MDDHFRNCLGRLGDYVLKVITLENEFMVDTIVFGFFNLLVSQFKTVDKWKCGYSCGIVFSIRVCSIKIGERRTSRGAPRVLHNKTPPSLIADHFCDHLDIELRQVEDFIVVGDNISGDVCQCSIIYS